MFGLRFKQVEAVSHWDDGETTVEIKTKPWLTEWDCKGLLQVQAEFHPRALGYRFLEHRLDSRTDVYARPWPLWAVLRVHQRVLHAFYAVLHGAHRRGFIHLATRQGLRWRWRDLRLGQGK